METKEEFAAGEMCASLKAAMGMPSADRDELAMVTLFFDRVHDGSQCDLYFLHPVLVTMVVF